MRARTLAVPCLAAFVACDFTAFDSYRVHTSIVSINAPQSYPNLHFGEAIAVATDAQGASWLVASGGLGTAVLAMPLDLGGMIGPASPLPRTICTPNDPNTCGMVPRIGVGLGGTSSWNGASLCAMTGVFGTVHQVFVSCFGDATPQTFRITPPSAFGQSGFGLAMAAPQHRRTGDPPTGEIVFVGANAGPGAVFAAQPSGVVNIAPMPPVGFASLGDTVAVGRLTTGGVTDLMVAAGGMMGTSVVVWRGDPRAGRAMQPIGCVVHTDEPGFGGAIALGDFDGDGSDDLAVGSGAGISQRSSNVHVYLASALGARSACDGQSWPESAHLSCSDANGAHCAGIDAGFGSALAAMDLDADGRDELAVGAPLAMVDGATHAGAVWIEHGSGASTSFALSQASVLRDATPGQDTELGAVLLGAHLTSRDELVASAPGVLAVRVFLCSGIPGDSPGGALTIDCRPMH